MNWFAALRNLNVLRAVKSINLNFIGCIIFGAFGAGKAGWFVSCCVIQASFLLLGVRNLIPMTWKIRVIVALFATAMCWRAGLLRESIIYSFGLYQLCFLLFPMRSQHPGSAMRVASLMFLGCFWFSTLSPGVSVWMVLVTLIVAMSLLISIYSKMSPPRAFWWFLRRSVRKESIFVLAMVTGLALLGLQKVRQVSEDGFGISGLSSSLSPGKIQALSLSDLLAMTVVFDRMPTFDPAKAYFRSGTFESQDGFSWTAAPSRILNSSITPESISSGSKATGSLAEAFTYEVTLSERFSTYLLSLDYGVKVIQDGKESYGRSNGSFFPLSQKRGWISYRGVSVEKNNMKLDDRDQDRARLLAVSKNLDEDVGTLAMSLRGSGGARQFIYNWGEYLKNNSFAYTLKVGDGSTSVKDFLFNSKSGYCEHFASASAILARMAGIPARTVAGFMGGSWSLATRTLTIKDLDAHAWAEIWDDSAREWMRIDATEFIAPDRIEMGSERWLRSVGVDIPLDWASSQNKWINAITLQLTLLTGWMQGNITQRFFDVASRYAREIFGFGLLGIVLSYVWYLRLKGRRAWRSPELAYIQRLEKALAKKHLGREAGETLAAWMFRVGSLNPKITPYLTEFTDAQLSFLYSKNQDPAELKRMRDIMRRILAAL
ncbi:MAG: DUF3488 and transglutaminase-like domain-containing protein [Proteobacteria bacterium]|nr:DUF3488 and transglutaminase-like domain-containing protein [Pseudomonadota bacterium]